MWILRLKVKGSTTVVNKDTFYALIVNCVKEEMIINSPEISTKLTDWLSPSREGFLLDG